MALIAMLLINLFAPAQNNYTIHFVNNTDLPAIQFCVIYQSVDSNGAPQVKSSFLPLSLTTSSEKILIFVSYTLSQPFGFSYGPLGRGFTTIDWSQTGACIGLPPTVPDLSSAAYFTPCVSPQVLEQYTLQEIEGVPGGFGTSVLTPQSYIPSSCVPFKNGDTYTLTLADDEAQPKGYGFKKLVITYGKRITSTII